VARLANPNTRFVAVVGPSGGGKSSVVRAGLVPALRADAIPGSDRWFVVDMLPGSEPFRELERALLRVAVDSAGGLMDELERDERGLLRAVNRILPPGSEVLLVVDQFEEVFTHVANEDVRARFLEALVAASTDPDHSVRVMVTLRADFYDRPLRYRGIGELLRAGTEVVLPLAAEELERATTGPAERVGVTIEREVVGAMVAEVAEQTGALPLLQYTLTELFERRKNGTLTLDAYRSVGGISGALVRRAEQIYASLGDTAKEATRQLFLRLVTLGDGSGDTRRRVLTTELLSLEEREDVMTVVIDAFGKHRLLTFDHDPQSRYPTVEVAHEALLTAWGRLRGWIDAAREDLRAHRRLAAAVADWTAAGQDPSFLVRGNRLEQFETWTATSKFALAETERAYLDASVAGRAAEAAEERAQKEREAALQRRSGNRLRALVGVLAVASIIAVALSLFARQQADVAEREERVAVARELSAAAVANLEVDPERSILLALEAVDRTRSVDGTVLPEAQEALHRAVLASRIVLSVPGLGGAVDWSPTGVFVTEGPEETGMIDIRDAATGDSVLEFEGHDIDVNDVAFGPDGSMLATTGDDGTLKMWDPSTGDLLSSLSGDGAVWGPSFSADGSMVAAAWPDDGSVRILDPSTGRVIRTFGGLEGPIDTALSPNGRRLVVASGPDEAFVFDVASGEQVFELRGHVYPINSVSWSPDGSRIATASSDGSVRIWDGATGRPVFELVGHTGVVLQADWSPDGARLVTSGSDATAKVWEIGDGGGREVISLSAQETRAGGTWAVFSPDGSHVMAGDEAISAVKIWDVSPSGGAEWANFPTDSLSPVDVAFLPDGRVIAPTNRGSVSVWDVETGREIRVIGPGEGPPSPDPNDLPQPVVAIDASPDGTRIATVRNFANTVSVWDPRTGKAVFEVQHQAELSSIDWSADSGHLVIASWDGSATIVDRTGREVRVLRGEGGFLLVGAEFSPDGRLLATSAFHERTARSRLTIWDWERGKVVKTIRPAGAGSVAFDPTGVRIATASNSGRVEVWDVNSGRRLVRLAGHSGRVNKVGFSPDGSRIATAGEDGTVRLFEADTGNEMLILRGHGYLVSGLSFSPDGTRLASASPDGIVRIWALDLDDLIEIANREKTRSLTNEECGQYLHLRHCPNN
jgi:WD40 repeat protein